MIPKEKFHQELWSFFEYFLDYTSKGIHLKCFSLIDEKKEIPEKGKAYLYEKITMGILAESANEIKAFATEYVETEKLDQVEGTSKPFHDSLKETLFLEIQEQLNKKLINHMIEHVKQDENGESILTMMSLYYAIYKNRQIPGYVLHPFYFKVFIPFLILAQEKLPEDIKLWQKKLNKKFVNFLESDKEEEGAYNLSTFFEKKSVQKITLISFAAILSVMNEKKDYTEKFFFTTNHLNKFHLKMFKMYIANGFHTLTDKPQRYTLKNNANDSSDHLIKMGVVPISYISGIVNRIVDCNFNKSLELIIQYFQSGKAGKYKKYLLKNYNQTIHDMNRNIWKEIGKVVEIQMQVCYRSKFLLRLVIHYVFDKSDAYREFWVKYIPNVERIIHYVYKDENDDFIKINKNLNQVVEQYRETKLFQGTDWEGFYKDPASKKIASQIITTIVDKASSKQDKNIPTTWFTNLLLKGLDEIALLRYFKKGLNNI